MTQEAAFKKFKEINPDMKIGQRKFDQLKPMHVRRMKISNRIVCCCTHCENIRLKVQTLNSFVREKDSQTSASITDSTLCDKNGPYHNAACV